MKITLNDKDALTCMCQTDRALRQWEKDLNFQMGVTFLVIGLLIVALAICCICSSK